MMTWKTLAAPQTGKQDWLCPQLCALRYPGRALAPGEMIPREVLSFVGAQLGVPADALLTYAPRRQNRPAAHGHAAREFHGYKTFTGRGARDLREWTFGQAEDARSNEDLCSSFLLCGVRKLPPFCPQYRQSSACARMLWSPLSGGLKRGLPENLTADVRDHLDKLLSEMLINENISPFSSGFATSRLVTTRLLLTVCSTGSNF
ncbi:DUF4158 domain-containing protein [Klebsiella pneumoniae]